MKPSHIASRTLALFLTLALSLPNSAWALRATQEGTGLEELRRIFSPTNIRPSTAGLEEVETKCRSYVGIFMETRAINPSIHRIRRTQAMEDGGSFKNGPDLGLARWEFVLALKKEGYTKERLYHEFMARAEKDGISISAQDSENGYIWGAIHGAFAAGLEETMLQTVRHLRDYFRQFERVYALQEDSLKAVLQQDSAADQQELVQRYQSAKRSVEEMRDQFLQWREKISREEPPLEANIVITETVLIEKLKTLDRILESINRIREASGEGFKTRKLLKKANRIFERLINRALKQDRSIRAGLALLINFLDSWIVAQAHLEGLPFNPALVKILLYVQKKRDAGEIPRLQFFNGEDPRTRTGLTGEGIATQEIRGNLQEVTEQSANRLVRVEVGMMEHTAVEVLNITPAVRRSTAGLEEDRPSEEEFVQFMRGEVEQRFGQYFESLSKEYRKHVQFGNRLQTWISDLKQAGGLIDRNDFGLVRLAEKFNPGWARDERWQKVDRRFRYRFKESIRQLYQLALMMEEPHPLMSQSVFLLFSSQIISEILGLKDKLVSMRRIPEDSEGLEIQEWDRLLILQEAIWKLLGPNGLEKLPTLIQVGRAVHGSIDPLMVTKLFKAAGVNNHSVVFDAGFGAGIALAVARSVLGADARGNELDGRLAGLAQQLHGELDQKDSPVFPFGKIRLERGDFLEASLQGVTHILAFPGGDDFNEPFERWVEEKAEPDTRVILVANEKGSRLRARWPTLTSRWEVDENGHPNSAIFTKPSAGMEEGRALRSIDYDPKKTAGRLVKALSRLNSLAAQRFFNPETGRITLNFEQTARLLNDKPTAGALARVHKSGGKTLAEEVNDVLSPSALLAGQGVSVIEIVKSREINKRPWTEARLSRVIERSKKEKFSFRWKELDHGVQSQTRLGKQLKKVYTQVMRTDNFKKYQRNWEVFLAAHGVPSEEVYEGGRPFRLREVFSLYVDLERDKNGLPIPDPRKHIADLKIGRLDSVWQDSRVQQARTLFLIGVGTSLKLERYVEFSYAGTPLAANIPPEDMDSTHPIRLALEIAVADSHHAVQAARRMDTGAVVYPFDGQVRFYLDPPVSQNGQIQKRAFLFRALTQVHDSFWREVAEIGPEKVYETHLRTQRVNGKRSAYLNTGTGLKRTKLPAGRKSALLTAQIDPKTREPIRAWDMNSRRKVFPIPNSQPVQPYELFVDPPRDAQGLVLRSSDRKPDVVVSGQSWQAVWPQLNRPGAQEIVIQGPTATDDRPSHWMAFFFRNEDFATSVPAGSDDAVRLQVDFLANDPGRRPQSARRLDTGEVVYPAPGQRKIYIDPILKIDGPIQGLLYKAGYHLRFSAIQSALRVAKKQVVFADLPILERNGSAAFQDPISGQDRRMDMVYHPGIFITAVAEKNGGEEWAITRVFDAAHREVLLTGKETVLQAKTILLGKKSDPIERVLAADKLFRMGSLNIPNGVTTDLLQEVLSGYHARVFGTIGVETFLRLSARASQIYEKHPGGFWQTVYRALKEAQELRAPAPLRTALQNLAAQGTDATFTAGLEERESFAQGYKRDLAQQLLFQIRQARLNGTLSFEVDSSIDYPWERHWVFAGGVPVLHLHIGIIPGAGRLQYEKNGILVVPEVKQDRIIGIRNVLVESGLEMFLKRNGVFYADLREILVEHPQEVDFFFQQVRQYLEQYAGDVQTSFSNVRSGKGKPSGDLLLVSDHPGWEGIFSQTNTPTLQPDHFRVLRGRELLKILPRHRNPLIFRESPAGGLEEREWPLVVVLRPVLQFPKLSPDPEVEKRLTFTYSKGFYRAALDWMNTHNFRMPRQGELFNQVLTQARSGNGRMRIDRDELIVSFQQVEKETRLSAVPILELPENLELPQDLSSSVWEFLAIYFVHLQRFSQKGKEILIPPQWSLRRLQKVAAQADSRLRDYFNQDPRWSAFIQRIRELPSFQHRFMGAGPIVAVRTDGISPEARVVLQEVLRKIPTAADSLTFLLGTYLDRKIRLQEDAGELQEAEVPLPVGWNFEKLTRVVEACRPALETLAKEDPRLRAALRQMDRLIGTQPEPELTPAQQKTVWVYQRKTTHTLDGVKLPTADEIAGNLQDVGAATVASRLREIRRQFQGRGRAEVYLPLDSKKEFFEMLQEWLDAYNRDHRPSVRIKVEAGRLYQVYLVFQRLSGSGRAVVRWDLLAQNLGQKITVEEARLRFEALSRLFTYLGIPLAEPWDAASPSVRLADKPGPEQPPPLSKEEIVSRRLEQLYREDLAPASPDDWPDFLELAHRQLVDEGLLSERARLPAKTVEALHQKLLSPKLSTTAAGAEEEKVEVLREFLVEALGSDLSDLLVLNRIFQEEVYGGVWESRVEDFKEMVLRDRSSEDKEMLIVARSSDGRIIGYSLTSRYSAESPVADIAEIVVLPDFRGKGIGQRLFKSTLEELKNWSGRKIEVVRVEDRSVAQVTREWAKSEGFQQHPEINHEYQLVMKPTAGAEEIKNLITAWIELTEKRYPKHYMTGEERAALERAETVLSARRGEALDLLNGWVRTPDQLEHLRKNYPHAEFILTDLLRMIVLRPENVRHIPTLEKALAVLENFHPDGLEAQQHNDGMRESVAGTLDRARVEAALRKRGSEKDAESAGLEERGAEERSRDLENDSRELLEEGRARFPTHAYGWGKVIRQPTSQIPLRETTFPFGGVLARAPVPVLLADRDLGFYGENRMGFDCLESSVWLGREFRSRGYKPWLVQIATPTWDSDIAVEIDGRLFSLTPGVDTSRVVARRERFSLEAAERMLKNQAQIVPISGVAYPWGYLRDGEVEIVWKGGIGLVHRTPSGPRPSSGNDPNDTFNLAFHAFLVKNGTPVREADIFFQSHLDELAVVQKRLSPTQPGEVLNTLSISPRYKTLNETISVTTEEEELLRQVVQREADLIYYVLTKLDRQWTQSFTGLEERPEEILAQVQERVDGIQSQIRDNRWVVVIGKDLAEKFRGFQVYASIWDKRIVIDRGNPADTLVRAAERGEAIHYYGDQEEGNLLKILAAKSGMGIPVFVHNSMDRSFKFLMKKIVADLKISLKAASVGLEEFADELQWLGKEA